MITVDTIKYEEKYKTIFYNQRPNYQGYKINLHYGTSLQKAELAEI